MNKSCVLTVVCFLAFSVDAHAQVSYGLRAGLNLTRYANRSLRLDHPACFVTGYADVDLGSRLTFQPGVSLQGKGDRFQEFLPSGDHSSLSATYTHTENIMAIEVPLNVIYNFPVSIHTIFVGVGPYVGINLSGDIRREYSGEIEERYSNLNSVEDIHFSGDDKNRNRMDAGFNFITGYRLTSGFLFSVGYGLGLTDLSPSNVDNTMSNRVLSFGVGFQF